MIEKAMGSIDCALTVTKKRLSSLFLAFLVSIHAYECLRVNRVDEI